MYGVWGAAVRVARRRARKIEEEREREREEGRREPYSGREVREGLMWVRERAKPRRNNKFRGHSRRSPRGWADVDDRRPLLADRKPPSSPPFTSIQHPTAHRFLLVSPSLLSPSLARCTIQTSTDLIQWDSARGRVSGCFRGGNLFRKQGL